MTCSLAALDQRTEISRWLFCERFPDWDLALVVVSELHSVIEPMWHGLGPSIRCMTTRAPRRRGLALNAYTNRWIDWWERWSNRFPMRPSLPFPCMAWDPTSPTSRQCCFCPSFFLYRLQFGHALYEPRPEWRGSQGLPLLDDNESWEYAVKCCLKAPQPTVSGNMRALLNRLPAWISSRLLPQAEPRQRGDARLDLSLDWMPVTHYQPHWPRMRAFALPAFYDGRIRINLVGRESHGRVQLKDYDDVCREIEDLLKACRDPRTGATAVASIDRSSPRDPQAVNGTSADIAVVWRGTPLALTHKDLGLIGPAPFRRTGGHTGGHGVCYLKCHGSVPCDQGIRSSFDVAPTILHLLGQPMPANISGHSLFASNPSNKQEIADQE